MWYTFLDENRVHFGGQEQGDSRGSPPGVLLGLLEKGVLAALPLWMVMGLVAVARFESSKAPDFFQVEQKIAEIRAQNLGMFAIFQSAKSQLFPFCSIAFLGQLALEPESR